MNSIEVFKTNVVKKREAKQLVEEMITCFPEYNVNFDLEDCDKILRVENRRGKIKTDFIINLLKSRHVECEVLN